MSDEELKAIRPGDTAWELNQDGDRFWLSEWTCREHPNGNRYWQYTVGVTGEFGAYGRLLAPTRLTAISRAADRLRRHLRAVESLAAGADSATVKE